MIFKRCVHLILYFCTNSWNNADQEEWLLALQGKQQMNERNEDHGRKFQENCRLHAITLFFLHSLANFYLSFSFYIFPRRVTNCMMRYYHSVWKFLKKKSFLTKAKKFVKFQFSFWHFFFFKFKFSIKWDIFADFQTTVLLCSYFFPIHI